jgi:hypothetical protein
VIAKEIKAIQTDYRFVSTVNVQNEEEELEEEEVLEEAGEEEEPRMAAS